MLNNTLKSTLPLAISLILSIIVGNFGIGRVMDLRNQISQQESTKAKLTEKVSTLKTLNSQIASSSTAATAALPLKNANLAAFTQIKTVAANNSLIISNLRGGAETKDNTNISSSEISFTTIGPKDAIYAFINGIEKTAPLERITKLKMDKSGDTYTAEIALKTFWATPPQKIPSTDQPIVELTSEEQTLVGKITALSLPQISEPIPNSEGGKTNPFE